MNPTVDFYFDKAALWEEETRALRTIVLDCGLTEVLKWGVPCYALDQRNIVLIHVFKDYCALLFFKGALLQDPDKLLIQQTANVQVARQMRFTSVKDIRKKKALIKSSIYEAIEVEKAGLKVPLKKTKEYPVPEELSLQLKKNPALKKAFDALTPGRQRGYLLYFAAAKQSATRVSRIEKSMEKIFRGEGVNDR